MSEQEAESLSRAILRQANLTLVLDRIETQQHAEAVRAILAEWLRRFTEAG